MCQQLLRTALAFSQRRVDSDIWRLGAARHPGAPPDIQPAGEFAAILRYGIRFRGGHGRDKRPATDAGFTSPPTAPAGSRSGACP